LFGLALASAADPGVWDLREGCILVRESKTDENKKVVVDPTAFTAVKVKHSGEENAFAPPTNGAAKSYLEAAAKAFFGESTFPAALTLVFDPTGAKAAVSTKSGTNSGERKKKPELVTALVALPDYAGQEAELKKKTVGELRTLWDAAQQNAGETPVVSEALPTVDEDATGDDKAES
jgi:hypothetical protein